MGKRCRDEPAILSVVLAVALSLAGCSTPSTTSQPGSIGNRRKLIIAVVGDGVGNQPSPGQRATSLNRAQGISMWQGAHAAYAYSPQLAGLREIVQLKPYDDRSLASAAERIGERLQANPRVLAVIGHATSSTTHDAAWLYDQAAIPLIMPIATSPEAPLSRGRNSRPRRLPDCFRLPPSDDLAQAPALAFVAEKIVHTRRTFLIRDVTEGARGYSKYLYDALKRSLSLEIIDRRSVSRGSTDFLAVANEIRGDHPDLIIFCGYGSTAQWLFANLRKSYARVALSKRPIILLSDGCLIPDLDTSGFRADLTFPAPDLSKCNPNFPHDFRILKKALGGRTGPSFGMYGYDAMLILGTAIEECKTAVSRDCLDRALSRKNVFRGVCQDYLFEHGESLLSSYYLFFSRMRAGGQTQWKQDRPISASDYRPFLTYSDLSE